MDAKDTLMSDLELWEEFGIGKLSIGDWLRVALRAQADISFNAGEDKGYAQARAHCEDVILPQERLAGIKEVVDWLNQDSNTLEVGGGTARIIDKYALQAKLKEWGIPNE